MIGDIQMSINSKDVMSDVEIHDDFNVMMDDVPLEEPKTPPPRYGSEFGSEDSPDTELRKKKHWTQIEEENRKKTDAANRSLEGLKFYEKFTITDRVLIFSNAVGLKARPVSRPIPLELDISSEEAELTDTLSDGITSKAPFTGQSVAGGASTSTTQGGSFTFAAQGILPGFG
jgi:hypothetical protein